jgi:hypothetical protein
MIIWDEQVYPMVIVVDFHRMMVMEDFPKIFLIVHFIFTIHSKYSNNLCHISAIWMMILVSSQILIMKKGFFRVMQTRARIRCFLLIFRQMDASCFSFWLECQTNKNFVFVFLSSSDARIAHVVMGNA